MITINKTHQLIRPFTDGVILLHPNDTVGDMISLESRGAYWLKQEYSKPLDLPELAVMLNRWYRKSGLNSGILSYGDFDEAENYYFATSFTHHKHPQEKITISKLQISLINKNGPSEQWYNLFITIPEAAEILKAWYS